MAGCRSRRSISSTDVNLDLAIAQIVSATNAIRALMPPGIQPPVIVQFNASSVPVLQISLSSDRLNEQQLYDYGIYRMRQQLAPIHGITLPTPAGGKYRQIMVDLDPSKLLAKGLTPLDVVNAVNAQNLTLPAGTAKIGKHAICRAHQCDAGDHRRAQQHSDQGREWRHGVREGRRPGSRRLAGAAERRARRTAAARCCSASSRTAMLRRWRSSTPSSDALKTVRAAAPAGLEIKELFDQSMFVKQSITGVLREGAIAAGLTALMILLFLGSWRSTLVVMISIPLAILTSLVALYFLGETLNTMTLGGLALAVGILVDDSTVTIENTHRCSPRRHSRCRRRRCTAQPGIAVPTLVSTLAISCVFTSVIFLDGPAKYLFTPLGLAVVFAMLASYGLSRTLTPITIGLLLKGEHHGAGRSGSGWFVGRPFMPAFERGFERMRTGYARLLTALLDAPVHRSGRGGPGAGAWRRDADAGRPRLLSGHRRRPDPASRPRAGRDADRGDGAASSSPSRTRSGEVIPGTRARADRRQHRFAGALLQSGVHGRLDHRRQ